MEVDDALVDSTFCTLVGISAGGTEIPLLGTLLSCSSTQSCLVAVDFGAVVEEAHQRACHGDELLVRHNVFIRENVLKAHDFAHELLVENSAPVDFQSFHGLDDEVQKLARAPRLPNEFHPEGHVQQDHDVPEDRIPTLIEHVAILRLHSGSVLEVLDQVLVIHRTLRAAVGIQTQ
ncbi:hypothetical protein Mapa_010442 [Marchantia paleacea]|nr:hypothetical protein Mapa_010442 [Marchantia paleacea]